ncbi:hypothetical protein AGMMS4952_27840 [Spirochaetia bacterium]|nr:hypothetical protein AGMMS4952_27840 [Spirochaetia bacterium]
MTTQSVSVPTKTPGGYSDIVWKIDGKRYEDYTFANDVAAGGSGSSFDDNDYVDGDDYTDGYNIITYIPTWFFNLQK